MRRGSISHTGLDHLSKTRPPCDRRRIDRGSRLLSPVDLPYFREPVVRARALGISLTGKRARTHIGILQDPGHAEPWIIAMSEPPSYLRTLEYSQRWGIEPMFSDFKSRGFGVEDTQIRYADRLARLLLVMALALYWAVSTGLWDAVHHPTPSEKKLSRSTQKGGPQQDLVVHPRAPAHHQAHPVMLAASATLDGTPELIDVQGST